MNRYLPKCVTVFWDNGRYVAVHWETSARCKHTLSGDRAHDSKPCNRAIGHGATRGEAIRKARKYFNLTE
jgi:hypothetical protein